MADVAERSDVVGVYDQARRHGAQSSGYPLAVGPGICYGAAVRLRPLPCGVALVVASLILAACGAAPAGAGGRPAAIRAPDLEVAAPAVPTESVIAVLSAPPASPSSQGRVILAHTPAQQSLSASCEAAAAALAMRVAGYGVSERQVMAAMPTDPRPPLLAGRSVLQWGNPWRAFVGHQDGWWPWKQYDPNHATGYGVYAPPVLEALHRLGAPGAHGGTGIALATLRTAIQAGHPVVVWLPSRHDFETLPNALATSSWTAWDGAVVTYALHEHTQTLLGVDAAGFYVGTPDYQWTPGYPFLSYWTDEEFARAFAFLGNMAIIVE